MKILDVRSTYRTNKCCVYIIRNEITGKVYIGQTVCFGRRIFLHASRSRNKKYNKPLYNSMRKHGLENFTVEILFEGLDLNEALRLEVECIEKYNCIMPGGYNMTEGGEGNPGFKHTDEWKAQASMRQKGNKHALGMKHTEIWKQEASARNKGNKHAAGITHTDDFKERRRLQFIYNNPLRKFSDEQKLEMYKAYINMEHKSQRKLAKRFGCSQNTIMQVVKKFSNVID